MSALTIGLILTLLFHLIFLGLVVAVVKFFPKSMLGEPAQAVLNWLPPFLGGKALRDWAASRANQLVQERLGSRPTGAAACRLAVDVERAATQAMLPLAQSSDWERIVACPETGQGRISVTAPEALAIAAEIRKHKSRAEQQWIYEQAMENAKRIASRLPSDRSPVPCALQGAGHVCRVFSHRPLHCRPLHAIALAKETAKPGTAASEASGATSEKERHEHWVAEGIEAGMKHALEAAGLDAKDYELNSAIATALAIPDAAERWARGEDVFRNTLR